MILGSRRYVFRQAGEDLKHPLLGFYDCADFLQYTKNLQDKVFSVLPYRGCQKKVICPQIIINNIIDDPYTEDWEYEYFKFKPCSGFDCPEWRLRYFDFVDFLVGCIEENKKHNCLSTVIVIKESLFNTFANEKYAL